MTLARLISGPFRWLLISSLVGAGGGGALLGRAARAPRPSYTAQHCYAIDGDTVICDAARIRLLGIDAPELPGHCRAQRHCAPGNPVTARRILARNLVPPYRIVPVKQDRYGRTVAQVANGRHSDLSCLMIEAGVIYRSTWDHGFSVLLTCPFTIIEASTGSGALPAQS